MVQIVNSLFADYLEPTGIADPRQNTIRPIAQQTYQEPLAPLVPTFQQAPQPVMATEQRPMMTEAELMGTSPLDFLDAAETGARVTADPVDTVYEGDNRPIYIKGQTGIDADTYNQFLSEFDDAVAQAGLDYRQATLAQRIEQEATGGDPNTDRTDAVLQNQQLKNELFQSAVKDIADKYGIPLSYTTKGGERWELNANGKYTRVTSVGGFTDYIPAIAGLALSFAGVPGALGTALGASGTAATALGSAIMSGATTLVQGGDLEDALKGAITSAITAGVSGGLEEAVAKTLGVSKDVAAGITAAGLTAAQGGNTEDALLSGFLAGASSYIRGELPSGAEWDAEKGALVGKDGQVIGQQPDFVVGGADSSAGSAAAWSQVLDSISNVDTQAGTATETPEIFAGRTTGEATADTTVDTSGGGMLTAETPAGAVEEVVVTPSNDVLYTVPTADGAIIQTAEGLLPNEEGERWFKIIQEQDPAFYEEMVSAIEQYGTDLGFKWKGIPLNVSDWFGGTTTSQAPERVVEPTQGDTAVEQITPEDAIQPEQPPLPPTDETLDITEVDIENLPPEVDVTPVVTPPTPPETPQVPTNVTGGGSAGGATGGGGLLTGQTTTQPAGTTTQPAGGTTQTVVDTTSTTQPTTQTQAQQTAKDILTHATSGGEYREDYDYNNDGRVTAADALMSLKLGGVAKEDLFGYVETIFGSTVDDITASLDSIGDLEEQVTTGQEIIGAITDERDALAGQVATLEGQLADAQAAADAAVAAGDANAAELQANADAIQEQLNATTAELDNANTTITGLETELGTTQETLAATQEQLATTQEERDAAQTAVVDLTGLLDNANTDLETKTAEIETLNTTVETLNTDIEVLTGDLDTANNNIADLEEQLQTAKDTNADNVADLESQLKAAQDNAAGIQESLDAKTAELDDANATIETLSGEVETLNTTVEDLNGQLEAKQGELDTANTTIADLTDKLGTSEAANVELTNQLNEANTEVATLEGQLTAANETNTDLTNRLEEANTSVGSLTEQLDTATTELDLLKDEYAAAVVANQENVDELEQAIKDKEDEIAGLEGDIDGLNKTIEDLNNEIADNEEEISGLEGSLADALSTIAGLEGDLATSRAETQAAIAEGEAAATAAGEAGYETGYGEGFGTGYGEGEGAGYGKGFGSGMLSASANQPVTTRPLPDMPEVKYGVPLASLFGTTDYMQQLLERLRA